MGVLDVLGGQAQNSLTGFADPTARAVTQTANEGMPNLLPGVSEIFQAEIARTITRPQATRWLAWNGVHAPANWFAQAADEQTYQGQCARMWQGVYDARLQVPTAGDLLALLNRGDIPEADARDALRRLGFGELHWIDAVLSLRNQIPGASDLIRYAVKEGWDAQAIRAFGYDQEFPPQLAAWMGKQGLGGSSAYRNAAGQQVPGPTWPMLEWIAHWQNVAPGQGFEMFQRLRPNRIQKFGGSIPGLTPFTFATLNTLLKVNDYPPFVRPWLAAIAYRLPRLLDVQHWYEAGAIDAAELYEQNLDLGYDPDSAKLRTDFLVTQTRAKQSKAARGNARAKILAAYKVGAIDADEAVRQLYALFVVGRPEEPAWPLLDREQQIELARSYGPIVAALADVDLELATETAKEVVAAVKRQYLKGFVNARQAHQQLAEAGLVAGRINQLLGRWGMILAGPRLMASTAQIARWARYGLVGLDVAKQWLINLGWGELQASLILAETNRSMALDQAKAQEKAAMTLKQQQKAREAQLRELARQREQVVKDLRKVATDAQLKRYYVRGLVSEAEFRAELTRRQLPPAEVNRRVADARIDRADELAKRAKAQQQKRDAAAGNGATTAAT